MRKKRRIAWMNVGLRSIINVIKATDWSPPSLWLFFGMSVIIQESKITCERKIYGTDSRKR